jgi:cold shock CspA family protein
MKIITVQSLGVEGHSGIVTPDVGDQQLLAHFARVQEVFRSLVRDQDIDLILKRRRKAR